MRYLRPSRAVVFATGVAVGVLGVGMTAGPAAAGPPGKWTALSSGSGVSSIDQPSLARVGSQLGVVWNQGVGTSDSVRYRSVSAAGAVGAARTVVSGWTGIIHDPVLLGGPSAATVLLSGQRTTTPGEVYDGAAMYRVDAPVAGTPWTLGLATAFPELGSPYASYGTSAVRVGSTVLTSYSLNTQLRVTGTDGSSTTVTAPACCTYDSALVRDAASGEVWLTWYANGSAASAKGHFAQRVRPTLGSRLQLPGSITTNQYGTNSLDPGQSVAATTRTGGGVWVAYVMGYPTANKIRVQRVGSTAHVDVKVKDARRVALTSYGSRLWLSWSSADGAVHATRSNTAVTRFGGVANVKPIKSGTSVYRLATEGSTGRLDTVVTAQPYPAPMQIFHTQVLPGLAVSLSKSKVKAGKKVKITVTDAGVPIAGAKVKVGSKKAGFTTKTTKANGKVKIKFKKNAPTGKRKISATRSGYASTKAKLKVT